MEQNSATYLGVVIGRTLSETVMHVLHSIAERETTFYDRNGLVTEETAIKVLA